MSVLFCFSTDSPILGDSVFSHKSRSKEYIEMFNSIFSSTSDEGTDKLMLQWAEYLKNVTSLDLEGHKEVLEKIDNDYVQAFIDLEKCHERQNAAEKRYSSAWIDSLDKAFGKKIIKENQYGINACLLALNGRNVNDECYTFSKQAVYMESLRNKAYDDFFNDFLGFISELDKHDQKLLEKKRGAALALLKLYKETPIADIQVPGVYRLSIIRKIAERETDKKLYEFLMGSQELSKPFDLLTASDDLKKYLN